MERRNRETKDALKHVNEELKASRKEKSRLLKGKFVFFGRILLFTSTLDQLQRRIMIK